MASQNQSSPVSGRLVAMQPSAIRAIHDLAQTIRTAEPGRSIIPLHFGEADRGTPEFIIDAAAQAMRDGAVFYENNSGRPDLKEALVGYYQRRYGVKLTPDHFVVTCGGTQAICLSMLSLLSPGDQIINVTPNWPNFTEAARIAGAEVLDAPLMFTEQGNRFELDFDRLQEVLLTSKRLRAVLVNSPSNPTGWVMTAEQQKSLYQLCQHHGVYLVSDEIYDRIVFSDQRYPTALTLSESMDQIIVINGFSKAYCMTGWRLGYLITQPQLAVEMARMQEFITSHAPSMAQVAGIKALADGEPFIEDNLIRYRDLRDLVAKELRGLPDVTVAHADGSFYTFFRVKGSEDSIQFCRDLLTATGVVLAPGKAFGSGGEGWLRLCIANEPGRLVDAIGRMGEYIGRS